MLFGLTLFAAFFLTTAVLKKRLEDTFCVGVYTAYLVIELLVCLSSHTSVFHVNFFKPKINYVLF